QLPGRLVQAHFVAKSGDGGSGRVVGSPYQESQRDGVWSQEGTDSQDSSCRSRFLLDSIERERPGGGNRRWIVKGSAFPHEIRQPGTSQCGVFGEGTAGVARIGRRLCQRQRQVLEKARHLLSRFS